MSVPPDCNCIVRGRAGRSMDSVWNYLPRPNQSTYCPDPLIAPQILQENDRSGPRTPRGYPGGSLLATSEALSQCRNGNCPGVGGRGRGILLTTAALRAGPPSEAPSAHANGRRSPSQSRERSIRPPSDGRTCQCPAIRRGPARAGAPARLRRRDRLALKRRGYPPIEQLKAAKRR